MKKWWVFIPATVLVYTLVVGSFKEWHGGASPVPRYLIPLIPLLVMCAALAFFNAKRLSTRVVITVLALFQLVLTVFTMIYPVAAYGLPASSNTLYRYFFGSNWLSSTLERIFPLFHPITASSVCTAYPVDALYSFYHLCPPLVPRIQPSGDTQPGSCVIWVFIAELAIMEEKRFAYCPIYLLWI